MRRLLVLGSLLLAPALLAPEEDDEPRWWKGNTHTHTLWSDGDGAPELVASWYREHGYHFLVLSDHDVLSAGERWFPVVEGSRLTPERLSALRERFGDVETREREGGGLEMRLRTLEELRERFEEEGRFLFIQGEELTDGFEGRPVHVNGLNLAEPIPPQGGGSVLETLQNNVDAILEQGRRLGRPVLAHVNHPNFGWGLGPEDLAALEGDRFFEVYNGHPDVRNAGDAEHASLDEAWDIALTLRLGYFHLPPLYALATDDAHHYHEEGPQLANAGRGWIVVRAAELTPEALIAAMRAGDFYATTGVELAGFAFDDGTYRVEIAAPKDTVHTTSFIGVRRGETTAEILHETRRNPALYELLGDELYVRARVRSEDGATAWLQPVTP